MRVTVSQAKGQLTDLVRRAEAGEEVILTRHGRAVVRLMAERPLLTPGRKQEVFDRIRAMSAGKDKSGPSAARSQDFLYDEHGLPK